MQEYAKVCKIMQDLCQEITKYYFFILFYFIFLYLFLFTGRAVQKQMPQLKMVDPWKILSPSVLAYLLAH